MNTCKLICIAFFALILAACAGSPTPVKSASTATSNSPSWIDNPDIDGVITGVGVAQPNPLGDKSMQRQTAIANARVELAGKIKTRVQNMFSTLNQQATSASVDGKKAIKSDVASRMNENVSRILTDQELVGSVVRQFWTDPADGNMYVLVVVGKDSVDNALSEIAKAQIQKEISQGEKNLDVALGKLDTAIANSK